jgi:hypothetical protein
MTLSIMTLNITPLSIMTLISGIQHTNNIKATVGIMTLSIKTFSMQII